MFRRRDAETSKVKEMKKIGEGEMCPKCGKKTFFMDESTGTKVGDTIWWDCTSCGARLRKKAEKTY